MRFRRKMGSGTTGGGVIGPPLSSTPCLMMMPTRFVNPLPAVGAEDTQARGHQQQAIHRLSRIHDLLVIERRQFIDPAHAPTEQVRTVLVAE